jgi:hypothetical protein
MSTLFSIPIKRSKTHILPEWYILNKKLGIYDYTFLEEVIITQYGTVPISKKQLSDAIYKLDAYVFLKQYDCFFRKNTEESLDLKINYIEKMNERENDRRINFDKKAESIISRNTILISFFTVLSSLSIRNILFDTRMIWFFNILFGLIVLILLALTAFIIIAFIALKPTKYLTMMPNIILNCYNKDIPNQKADYLERLYLNVTKNIDTNEKRGKLLDWAVRIFIFSLIILIFLIIGFIFFLKKNIIYIC